MPDDIPTPALPPRESIELVADVLRRVLDLAKPADECPVAAELLTRAQVAQLLGISLSSFGDLEARGFIGPEAIRLGDGSRIVRYSRAELVGRWIPAGCPPRAKWNVLKAANPRKAG